MTAAVAVAAVAAAVIVHRSQPHSWDTHPGSRVSGRHVPASIAVAADPLACVLAPPCYSCAAAGVWT